MCVFLCVCGCDRLNVSGTANGNRFLNIRTEQGRTLIKIRRVGRGVLFINKDV